MRSVDSDTQAALQARALVARNFIYIVGKSLDGGSTVEFGFWNGFDTITATVVDGDTLLSVSHDYAGSGVALTIDDIPLSSDISIRTINASLSQIDGSVAAAVRGADLRLAPVQIHRGLLNLNTNALVSEPLCRFIGTVDKCVVVDAAVGGGGQIQLTLASHTRELTRTNPDVCSDESQQRRQAGDRFYKDVGVVGSWQIFWGSKKAPVKG